MVSTILKFIFTGSLCGKRFLFIGNEEREGGRERKHFLFNLAVDDLIQLVQ
jgi:hypothetical protein